MDPVVVALSQQLIVLMKKHDIIVMQIRGLDKELESLTRLMASSSSKGDNPLAKRKAVTCEKKYAFEGCLQYLDETIRSISSRVVSHLQPDRVSTNEPVSGILNSGSDINNSLSTMCANCDIFNVSNRDY